METQNNSVLEVQKEFPVSRDRLFQAWNNPDELKKWWKPMESQLQHVVNDLKAGGEISYKFQRNEGITAFTITGKYEEVEINQRLKYTWNWELPEPSVEDGKFKLTIIFEESGNGSILKVKQENFISEESLLPHRQGWEKGLNDLHQFVSGSQPNIPSGQAAPEVKGFQNRPGSNNETEVSGYNEIEEQEKVGGYN